MPSCGHRVETLCLVLCFEIEFDRKFKETSPILCTTSFSQKQPHERSNTCSRTASKRLPVVISSKMRMKLCAVHLLEQCCISYGREAVVLAYLLDAYININILIVYSELCT